MSTDLMSLYDHSSYLGVGMSAVTYVASAVSEITQTSIIWFSMGLAVYQMLVIARTLMSWGASPIEAVLPRSISSRVIPVGK